MSRVRVFIHGCPLKVRDCKSLGLMERKYKNNDWQCVTCSFLRCVFLKGLVGALSCTEIPKSNSHGARSGKINLDDFVHIFVLMFGASFHQTVRADDQQCMLLSGAKSRTYLEWYLQIVKFCFIL